MNDKSKLFFKRAILIVIVFAIGITVGVFAVKSGSKYKGLEETAKRLSHNTNMELTHIALAGLDDPKALYDALYNECLYLEIIARTGYCFFNDDDKIEEEDFTLLYNTFTKARDIAEKLSDGEEISEEDSLWIEVFVNTVHSSLSGSSHYKTFLELFY